MKRRFQISRKPGEKVARTTFVKRGVLHGEQSRTITQHLNVDEFRELPERKRQTRKEAEALGHDLGTWHRRPNDVYGRWNAYCQKCNLLAVVAVESPEFVAKLAYGGALITKCNGGRR